MLSINIGGKSFHLNGTAKTLNSRLSTILRNYYFSLPEDSLELVNKVIGSDCDKYFSCLSFYDFEFVSLFIEFLDSLSYSSFSDDDINLLKYRFNVLFSRISAESAVSQSKKPE
ncbi:hypothetical protein [Capybara microvirus Cap1_SP_115]|nr:hypothetical protein [Capybara microvirus Cap1_SP_115]